jgi:hypothetical protein
MHSCIKTSLAIFLALLSGTSRADVIVYDNLATAGSSAADFNASSGFAQSFANSAAAPANFNSISLNLFRTDAGNGSFSVQVWSSTANKPTTKLATLLTANWSDVSTSKTNPFNATSSSFTAEGKALQLDTGVTYWLAVVTGSSGQNFWALGANTSLGQFSTSPNSNPTTSTNWSDALTGSSLGGQITVSVPEPSTMTLGAALLVIAPLLPRRRKMIRLGACSTRTSGP